MKVLIADKFEKVGIDQLQALGCAVTVNPDLSGDTLRESVGEVTPNVLIVRSTEVTAEILEAAQGLELVIRAGAGFNTINIKAAAAKGIQVANCPGKNSVAVAELVMGLMLALDRRIVDNTVDLRGGKWNKKLYSAKARGLKGRTLGIVGLGTIGFEVAKRAKAFEMELIYSDVIDQSERAKQVGAKEVSFEKVLAQSDFITLHVPGGEGTKHLIGAEQLAQMKPTAYLINCSRGGVVDEKALASAIEAGTIAGVGLDVYEIEPGASDKTFADPVVKTHGVYGTHHIGASTEQAQLAVADEVVRIVEAKLKGQPVPNVVN